MLWARWGALGVVNTHMTFQYNDGGAQRRKQQAALAALVATLLGAPLPPPPAIDPSLPAAPATDGRDRPGVRPPGVQPPGVQPPGVQLPATDPSCPLASVPHSSRGACSAVLLIGDLNHALPSQVVRQSKPSLVNLRIVGQTD